MNKVPFHEERREEHRRTADIAERRQNVVEVETVESTLFGRWAPKLITALFAVVAWFAVETYDNMKDRQNPSTPAGLQSDVRDLRDRNEINAKDIVRLATNIEQIQKDVADLKVAARGDHFMSVEILKAVNDVKRSNAGGRSR